MFRLLALFGLGLTVPLVALSAFTTINYASSERARLEGQTREILDNVVATVDRELSGQIVMLRVLATSPALETKDLSRFRQQASELAHSEGVAIVLRDRSGQHLVNTFVAPGLPLPVTENLPDDRAVVDTGQPYISDIFSSVVAQDPRISVTVPVFRAGEIIGFLSTSQSLSWVQQRLQSENVVAPNIGVIADRKGMVIARSAQPEVFAGKPVRG